MGPQVKGAFDTSGELPYSEGTMVKGGLSFHTTEPVHWLLAWSRVCPDKAALIHDGRPITYAELLEGISRTANLLLGLGLGRGDRVAVLLHNCPEFIEAFFAISWIGAIMVPVNFRFEPSEIAYVLKDAEAQALLFGGEFCRAVASIREELPVPSGRYICLGEEVPPWALDYSRGKAEASSTPPSVNGEDWEAPHILMYTSGTTGFPKGALLSKRKTFFNVLNALHYYRLRPEDVAVLSRPLFHSGGLIVDTLPLLYTGGTVVMKRRFDPEELLWTVERYRVTILETSATMYRFILQEGELDRHDLSSVRCFFTGGEVVPLSLLEAYRERGVLLCQLYGQTETSTITYLPPEHAARKMGSAGMPVPHGEVKLVDEEGQEVPPGEVGEVVVEGPILMSGYWRRPAETAEVMKDGWLHTGDLARRDEEGFHWIVDRERNVFISGGENVYPAEVERILLEHPKVAEAAVVGVPDPRWGEVGKAYVVPKPGEGIAPEEVIEWCRGRMARYKIPRYVEVVEALPRNASGKVDRKKLRRSP